jgi:CheY-like chemotaxis protein
MEAESGEDALSAVMARRPDLILMDIQLLPFSQALEKTAILPPSL